MHAALASAASKLERLRAIDPVLIDASLRECSVGSLVGQTLDEKLAMLGKLRAFGFTDILLGTLNYALPDELEVDDDFMMRLRDDGADLTGCFAATSIGRMTPDGFVPDPSLHKLVAYGVPDTILELYAAHADAPDAAALVAACTSSIAWLHDRLPASRILVNLVDGCDAFADNLDTVLALLDALATQPILGVSLQDDRGTFLPFQVAAYVALARERLAATQRLLVHVHAGAGFENASVMESLLAGADGAWGALGKCGPVVGHASLGELIANLARVGNPHVERFELEQLVPLVAELRGDDPRVAAATRQSLLGADALSLPLEFFAQRAGRFMDLPPGRVGGAYRYRVTPVVNDPHAISHRLTELGLTATPAVIEQMIRLMRREQRAGLRIVYDDEQPLRALLSRASHAASTPSPS